MTTRNALSETFISDIGLMTEEFNRIMTRDEYRRLMEAIKICDFHWAELTIEGVVGHCTSVGDTARANALELQRRWRDCIKREGGIDNVNGLSFLMSRRGKWPWWSHL